MNIGSSWFQKKRLLEKVRHFHKHLKNNDGKVGTYHRGIELNLNNACNLRCKYCFTGSPKGDHVNCLLYTSPSPRDGLLSRMPSSA